MDTIGTKIRDRVFRTPNDIMAAKRDERRILLIEEKTDFCDREALNKLLSDFQADRYHFETLLGEDFKEEVEERLKKLPMENSAPKKNQRKRQPKKKEEKDFEDYDALMQRKIVRELKKQKRKQRFLYVLLTMVATFCLAYVVFYYALYEKNEAEYDLLSSMKDEEAVGVSDEITISLNEEGREIPPILAKYEKLYQKNKRIVGWIKIEGTKIDYPVMQTVNNEYYLDHNYNQEYDKNGSIFMDKDCTAAFPNTNMILYGHHMKSGRMFGDLDLYSKKSYFEKHPQILFDTIYEEGVYDVMYVFRSRIYNADEVVFKYYQFMDVNSEDEFYSAMDEMSRIALYDTGVTAEYGDRLITLSTCDSSETDGRFVVVAKKVN